MELTYNLNDYNNFEEAIEELTSITKVTIVDIIKHFANEVTEELKQTSCKSINEMQLQKSVKKSARKKNDKEKFRPDLNDVTVRMFMNRIKPKK